MLDFEVKFYQKVSKCYRLSITITAFVDQCEGDKTHFMLYSCNLLLLEYYILSFETLWLIDIFSEKYHYCHYLQSRNFKTVCFKLAPWSSETLIRTFHRFLTPVTRRKSYYLEPLQPCKQLILFCNAINFFSWPFFSTVSIINSTFFPLSIIFLPLALLQLSAKYLDTSIQTLHSLATENHSCTWLHCCRLYCGSNIN